MHPGEAEKVLPALLNLMWTIGLVIAFYGQIYSNIAIAWLCGAKWAALVRIKQNAGEVLACYSGYILVLAVNGVSDAVVTAKSSPRDLRTKNWWMLSFSM